MKQVKFYLNESEYEKIRKTAEELGTSVPSLVKTVVIEYFKLRGEQHEYWLTHFEERIKLLEQLEKRVSLLEKKYEQLLTEIGRIENDLIKLVKWCTKIGGSKTTY